MVRILRFSILTLVLGLGLIAFQNCSDKAVFSGSSSQQNETESSGNGFPYEGKILDSVSQCSDSTPAFKIRILSQVSALLLKENCAIVMPPRSLSVGVELDLASLQYQGQQLVLEPISSNKIAFQQFSENWNTSSASSINSQVFASPSAAGNLVVCHVLYNSPNGTAHVTSVQDSVGNVYRAATPPFGGARELQVAGYTPEIWYAENIQGGAGLQVTATFSEAMPANQLLSCFEYSGVATEHSLDQVAYGANSDTVGPVQTNWSNELVLILHSGGPNPAAIPGFTARGSSLGDSAAELLTSTVQAFSLTLTDYGVSAAAVLTFRSQE